MGMLMLLAVAACKELFPQIARVDNLIYIVVDADRTFPLVAEK